jgi:polyhydroxyalkanoate synthesis regulator phasin
MAKSGAKGTATAASAGAKRTRTTAKGAATKAGRAGGSNGGSVVEQLANGTLKPQDVLILTRERVQEALDEAAARGRMTRKDANDLVTELVNRGKHHGDEFRKEFDSLIERGRGQLEAASKRARKAPGADRIVRGADRARRAAGVGPSFPILGYDKLNATQVQRRVGDLSKPDLRKVLTYEKSHANRKTVTSALEKAIG